MAAILASLSSHYLEPFYSISIPEASAETAACMAVILCPYVYYFWLWHWPSPFARFSEALGYHPSTLMSYFAHVMKFALFSLLLFYPGAGSVPSVIGAPLNVILRVFSPNLNVATHELDISMLTLLDLVLLAMGQALNFGVYKSLGTVGTYYGNRFGDPPAWVTGFPYNIGISDPQYWGSILTVIATLNLLQTKKNPFFQLTLLLSYVFMMVVEAKERTPAYVLKGKKRKD